MAGVQAPPTSLESSTLRGAIDLTVGVVEAAQAVNGRAVSLLNLLYEIVFPEVAVRPEGLDPLVPSFGSEGEHLVSFFGIPW